MKYEVRLKTGFYETTLYQLSISEGILNITPIHDDMKSPICINEENLISILLLKSKHSEIEIKTKEDTFSGVFNQNPDLREIRQELKMKVHTRIIYKEE
jgi:hypothetical protein